MPAREVVIEQPYLLSGRLVSLYLGNFEQALLHQSQQTAYYQFKDKKILPPSLNTQTLFQAVDELRGMDQHLDEVVGQFGPPPMWGRNPGFAALVKIILEQQVSLASGQAVYSTLQCRLGKVSAHKVASTPTSQLRRWGLTRQKATYCSELAQSVVSGRLNLRSLTVADDNDVRTALIGVKGIGPWTASVYLLMVLRRPDIWPDGDVALAESARQVKRLNLRPGFGQLRDMAASWAPWRSVAARILWHAYLSRKKARGFLIRS